MNSGIQLVLGMCIGALILGAIVFGYALIREIRSLTRFTAVLVPLLQNEEIVKGLASFRVLATVGFELGKKVDTLTEATRAFLDFAIARPQQVPAGGAAPASTAPPDAASSVHLYSEEEAAARAAAAENRGKNIETDDSRVVIPQEQEVDHF
jgi:hypothetical protein